MLLAAVGTQPSTQSVRDLQARLTGLLSAAEEWTWIRPRTNPARGKLWLPSNEPVRPKRILAPAEFHKLVAALSQPYSTLVVLAALAGLRRGELAALRWLDILPGCITVDEAVYRGKLDTPKTRKSVRDVSIGPLTQQTSEDWRRAAKFTGPG